MAEFDAELLDPKSTLDRALVRACKKLVARLILNSSDVMYNEMSVSDAVTLAYEDVR